MIVNTGKQQLVELISDAAAVPFTFIAVGDGGDDTSTSQTQLDNEIHRKTAGVNRVGNTLVYTVTFTGDNLTTNVIRELGIFNVLTKGAAGEKLLARVNFDAIGPLTSSDEITFTFRLEVE